MTYVHNLHNLHNSYIIIVHELATLDTSTVFSCASQKPRKQHNPFVLSMVHYNDVYFNIFEASLKHAFSTVMPMYSKTEYLLIRKLANSSKMIIRVSIKQNYSCSVCNIISVPHTEISYNFPTTSSTAYHTIIAIRHALPQIAYNMFHERHVVRKDVSQFQVQSSVCVMQALNQPIIPLLPSS